MTKFNATLASVLLLVSSAAYAKAEIGLSSEEFKMFRQYQNALEDPRVQKIKPGARLAAIAKDAGFKLKELEAAIRRGEAAGDVKALCEANLAELVGKGPMGNRVGKVEVDTTDPHAVAYVEWTNEDPGQREEEASLLAAEAAEACPIVSTIQVLAHDRANPKGCALLRRISLNAARNIQVAKVKDFADTRYFRLFEIVKDASGNDRCVGSPVTPTP